MQPALRLVAFFYEAMTNHPHATVRLPRLTSNPYVRCDRNLRTHPDAQAYWLNVFRESLRTHFECGGLTDPERMAAGCLLYTSDAADE